MPWPSVNPSSPSWGSPIAVDQGASPNGFADAVACSLPALSSPIPSVIDTAPSLSLVAPHQPSLNGTQYNAEYLLEQEFIQYRKNFTPLGLNTEHPDYAGFYLAAEGPRSDHGGGLVKWKRAYAAIPPSWNEWQSYTCSYPGLVPSTAVLLSGVQRMPLSLTVTARLQHDYFLVDEIQGCFGSTVGAGNPNYSDPGDIPVIRAMPWCAQIYYSGAVRGGSGMLVQTLAANTLPTSGTGVLTYSGGTTEASYPAYEYMLADAAKNKWAATVTNIVIDYATPLAPVVLGTDNGGTSGPAGSASSVFGGQIPAEDSRLVLWHGGIYVRTTRYVLAR